jgi:hypothetical protein
LRVNGNVAPETVNPEPAMEAELTVTAAVPVDERVTVCAVAVFTGSLPKARLAVLALNVSTVAGGASVKEYVT